MQPPLGNYLLSRLGADNVDRTLNLEREQQDDLGCITPYLNTEIQVYHLLIF